jgi:hypothetical protein
VKRKRLIKRSKNVKIIIKTQNSSILKGERPAGAKTEFLEKKRKRNAILIRKIEKKRLNEKNKDFKKELIDITGVFYAIIKSVIY